MKFNLLIKHNKRLITKSANEIEQLQQYTAIEIICNVTSLSKYIVAPYLPFHLKKALWNIQITNIATLAL